jgi:hypothetical protein
MYVASAGKPLRTASYRVLPRPGAVIGDQVATDGLLARRLGYTFLHWSPPLTGVPLGPRLMHLPRARKKTIVSNSLDAGASRAIPDSLSRCWASRAR